jgi:3-methyladenine DNA glycosylase/8-oxoguanine DNA glycosylase
MGILIISAAFEPLPPQKIDTPHPVSGVQDQPPAAPAMPATPAAPPAEQAPVEGPPKLSLDRPVATEQAAISMSPDPLDQLVWKYQKTKDDSLLQRIWEHPMKSFRGKSRSVGEYTSDRLLAAKKNPDEGMNVVRDLAMKATDSFERYLSSTLRYMTKGPWTEADEASVRFGKYLNNIPDDIVAMFDKEVAEAKGDQYALKEIYARMVIEAYQRGEWETVYKTDPATGALTKGPDGQPMKVHVPGRVQQAINWWNDAYKRISSVASVEDPKLALWQGSSGAQKAKVKMQKVFDDFNAAHPAEAKRMGITTDKYGPGGPYRLMREMLEPWKQGVTPAWVHIATERAGLQKGPLSLSGDEERGPVQFAAESKSALDEMIEREEEDAGGIADRVKDMDLTGSITVSRALVKELEGRSAKAKHPKDLQALLKSREMQIARELEVIVRDKEVEEYGEDSTDDADDLRQRIGAILARASELQAAAEQVTQQSLEDRQTQHARDVMKGTPGDHKTLPNPAKIMYEIAGNPKYLEHLGEEEGRKFRDRKSILISPQLWGKSTNFLADMLYDASDVPLYQVAKAVATFKPMAGRAEPRREISRANSDWILNKWFPENAKLFDAPLPIEGGMLKLTPEKRLRWSLSKVTKDFMKALADDEMYAELSDKLGISREAASELVSQIRIMKYAVFAAMARAS